MAYLQKKKIRGGVYYYFTQTKRIDGKSKKVQQIYLGTPDQIFEKCSAAGTSDPPVKASHLEFGLPGALYQQALEIGLIPLINSYATTSTASLDVGQYLVLAAINRVCEPRSKNGIGSWYNRTSLPGLFTIPVRKATGRLFWQAMDRLPTSAIPEIESELWGTILDQHSMLLDVLVYDTTNFYSYVAEQTKSDLYKKGHNKASRYHLRQVGMAASVVRGLGLPLIHELYEGSEHDATLFPTAISRTIDRVLEVSGGKVKDLTVVFDKGNNSKDNVDLLTNRKVHFIGSLSPSHYRALCSIRLSRYTPLTLNNSSETLVFDTQTKAFDRSVRVVITYNAKTARKQDKRFQKNIGKALAELAQVQWAKVKDPEAKIREVVKPSLPASLFVVEGEGPNLKVGLDQPAVRAYKKRFGKNLIFTDRQDLPVGDVVQCYRDRDEVERVFGEMNDPETVPFQPVRHWTDQKIVMHAFICILGLLLLKLLQLKLERDGIRLSLVLIKDELSPLHLQIFVSRSGKLFKIISDRSKLQSRMFDLFGMANIASALGAQFDSS
ncbi:IS1634 family transposase [Thermodesulfobacteriota bacterium]